MTTSPFRSDALGTLSRRPACSVTFHPGASMSDGHPLLARNMDFPTTTFSEFQGRPPFPGERAAVADPWIVELHPDDGHASICIGFGDVMGGMDGINAAGLAVALLADSVQPPLEPTATPQVGLSEGQVVRYLLDTCATVAEAKDALRLAKHYYQGLPCHYVVADRSGASFVWEHSRYRNREVIVEPPVGHGDRLVCTNHLLHRWPDATDLSDDEDEAGTAVRTYARWRTLTAATRAVPSSRATRWASSSPGCGSWRRRRGHGRSGTPCTTSPRPPSSSASSSATTVARAPTARRSSSPSAPADQPIGRATSIDRWTSRSPGASGDRSISGGAAFLHRGSHTGTHPERAERPLDTPKEHTMRKLATIAAISAAVVGGGLAVASTVSADSPTGTFGTITKMTTSFSNPTNQSIPVHEVLVPNQNVLVRCAVDGQTISGDNDWIRIGRDDKLGFVHASTIQVNGHIPNC